MHPEVLNDVVERFKHADFTALDNSTLQQVLRPQLCQDAIHISQSAFKYLNEFLSATFSIGIEFLLPLSCVGFTANSAHDPLADISCQVQYQIADAVRSGIGTPPQVLVGNCLDAPPNPG
jgi:hypothetical protein